MLPRVNNIEINTRSHTQIGKSRPRRRTNDLEEVVQIETPSKIIE
jgi:hypothetical protein